MKPRYVYRSAITGRFLSAAYAQANPRTTIKQRVEPACKGHDEAEQ